MADKIKEMRVTEFRELGFLQEANRQFFHPLGLALSIVVLGEKAFDNWLDEAARTIVENLGWGPADTPLVHKAMREQIELLVKTIGFGPGERLGPVWDCREDAEGVTFGGPDNYGLDPVKAATVDAEARRHTVARLAMFGSNVQPIPEAE